MLFLTLCGVAAVAAQTTTPTATTAAPPDLVVLQKKWRSYTRNPALDVDPFDANEEFEDARQAQRINEIRNTIRARGNESREPPPVRSSRINNPDSKTIVTYVYTAKVKNTGAKTVRFIEWGYTFLDPETSQELGSHVFTAKLKLRPGQENELAGRSNKAQTATVNVKNAGKALVEQVVIYRVEYEDGTFWQPPQQ